MHVALSSLVVGIDAIFDGRCLRLQLSSLRLDSIHDSLAMDNTRCRQVPAPIDQSRILLRPSQDQTWLGGTFSRSRPLLSRAKMAALGKEGNKYGLVGVY